MRIAVAVTNDLATDQRVERASSALVEAGHQPILIGRLLPESLPLSRPYPTIRMRLLFRKKIWFYAEYNLRLFFQILRLRPDVVYANDTDTLLASFLAARLLRRPLFFDAHEMFPEVPELAHRPHVKRIWQFLERRLIPRVDAAVTVCQSIADRYGQQLGVQMAVVRNVPPHRPLCQASSAQPPVILYQGAVNVGRGIDRLIDAMEFLPDYRFVVAGIGDEYEQMKAYAAAKPWHDRIAFLGRLEPRQLHALTPTATLGVCLLENIGLNYYYSLPNRLGDFIAAGVPMLATDFPEIHHVIETYGIGTLVSDQCGEALAQVIRKAVENWHSLPKDEQQRRMTAAGNDLCWENDKKVLLASFNKILINENR